MIMLHIYILNVDQLFLVKNIKKKTKKINIYEVGDNLINLMKMTKVDIY